MRKNILEIKRKLEHKLNENMTINDIECNNYLMMTSSLNQINRILFCSVNGRAEIDTKAILDTAISLLEDKKNG